MYTFIQSKLNPATPEPVQVPPPNQFVEEQEQNDQIDDEHENDADFEEIKDQNEEIKNVEEQDGVDPIYDDDKNDEIQHNSASIADDQSTSSSETSSV